MPKRILYYKIKSFFYPYILIKKIYPYYERYFLPFQQTLLPLPPEDIPKNFWKFGIEDLICFITMAFSTLSIWLAVGLYGSLKSVVKYWDGPNYVYAAITLYEIPYDNPWFRYFQYKPSYFACHLPGFPIIIRFFSFFTCGNYEIADYLAILFCSLLLSYSFRRLLIAYNCVQNPTFSTQILSIFPLRLAIYHSVGASEPLFMSFSCLALVFYKFDYYNQLLFAIWGACFTRIEGMAVGFTMGVCFLLSFRIKKAFGMFLTFLSTFALLAFHLAMFGDAFAYIHFNSNFQHLIVWPPFPELSHFQSTNVVYMHSFLNFYLPLTIGTFSLYSIAAPPAIFSTTFLIYLSLLRHVDIFRYSLSSAIFAYIVGFDGFFSHPIVKKVISYLWPVYFIMVLLYCSGQINSNNCPDEFWRLVMDASLDKIH